MRISEKEGKDGDHGLSQHQLSDICRRENFSCVAAAALDYWNNMQHDPAGRSSVSLLCGRRASPKAFDDSQNFAETLPMEMSLRIFGELDAESLCSASRTCRLWRDIIEQSEQLWRRQCLLVRAVCQREVDKDRGEGLSWKVTLVRNYTRSCAKRDWMGGRYSSVSSADELLGRNMVPFDAETWGEILQAELNR
uniref:F-box protein 48 n=1 Tax=Nothobranchius pienaari TaxID=704102 RepID=A0A1A8LS14_9TELE